jgi:hypothetical protein
MNEPFVAFKDKYPLSFRIPPRLHTMLKAYCADTEQTIQSFVENLIVEFFHSSAVKKPSKKRNLTR